MEWRQLNMFKGGRQRGEEVAPPLEFEMHCALADALDVSMMPGWIYTHFPAGEHRTPVTAGRLKRMGTKPGFPDFQFFGPGQACFFLELKRPRSGRLSEEQSRVMHHLLKCGHIVHVTDSVKDALGVLKDLGIVRATVSA